MLKADLKAARQARVIEAEETPRNWNVVKPEISCPPRTTRAECSASTRSDTRVGFGLPRREHHPRRFRPSRGIPRSSSTSAPIAISCPASTRIPSPGYHRVKKVEQLPSAARSKTTPSCLAACHIFCRYGTPSLADGRLSLASDAGKKQNREKTERLLSPAACRREIQLGNLRPRAGLMLFLAAPAIAPCQAGSLRTPAGKRRGSCRLFRMVS